MLRRADDLMYAEKKKYYEKHGTMRRYVAECKRRSEENSDNAVPGIFIPGISFVLKETPE